MLTAFFDILIAMLIVAAALPAIFLLLNRWRKKESWEAKRAKASLIIAIALFALAGLVIYGSFIEPRRLTVARQTIDLPNVQKPFTIALITDIHVGPYKRTEYVKKIVQKIESAKPDLVLLGGDYLLYDGDMSDARYLAPLAKLVTEFPTYAIPGNHEFGLDKFVSQTKPEYRLADLREENKKMIEDLGIKYLVNEMATATIYPNTYNNIGEGIKNQTIYLFGGDEYWSENLKFDALEKRREKYPTLALIHNPSAVFEAVNLDIDLMLSGHTHGGQIRLPFIGPLGRVDNVLPAKWYKGLHEYQSMQFYVSAGAGETGPRARLFNPPEIAILTIK